MGVGRVRCDACNKEHPIRRKRRHRCTVVYSSESGAKVCRKCNDESIRPFSSLCEEESDPPPAGNDFLHTMRGLFEDLRWQVCPTPHAAAAGFRQVDHYLRTSQAASATISSFLPLAASKRKTSLCPIGRNETPRLSHASKHLCVNHAFQPLWTPRR